MSIGRILNTAFGAIFGNLFVMLGIAFLFGGLPQGAISYFQQSLTPQLAAGSISLGQYFGLVVLGSLLNMVFAVLAQGALVRATIASSHGERATFGECMSTAFRRLLPLLGLGIVSGLAVGFAAILLIVPGIILAVMWYVAAPVVVADDVACELLGAVHDQLAAGVAPAVALAAASESTGLKAPFQCHGSGL
jgi:uncharacterized membrane protein (Fun14 family)